MISQGPKHWPHQLEALRFIHKRRGSLLWIPMRAGKTRIAIDYIQNTEPGPTLIVCPHKVIKVWAAEFEKYLFDSDKFLVKSLSDVSIAERANVVLECVSILNFNNFHNGANRYPVFIINYDVISEEPLAKQLLKINWQYLIFDECHRLQAPAGKQSRFAAKLAKNAKKIIGLSGTPGNPLGNPQKKEMRASGIIDIYGVMRTIAPGLFAYTNQQFKAKYGIWNAFTPFPKIEGYQNQADFDSKFTQVCYHVDESDLAYTMPEVIEQTRPVKLPASVQAAYDELEKEMVIQWDDDSLSVENALVKQLRLQQMTAGFMQMDKDDLPCLVHTEKFDATREIISDLPESERVIVFCQFKAEMDELAAILKSLKRSIFHIRGGIDTSDNWKQTPGAILIVQIQAGGEGLDLSAANYCIYNSLCHSLRLFQQSFKRPQLPDKKHPVAYYYIVAEGTIDETIVAALQAKEEVVDSVRQRLKAKG